MFIPPRQLNFQAKKYSRRDALSG